MEHITIGQQYNPGKIAYVECVTNDPLKKISIKGECFLLLIITEGTAVFSVNDTEVSATAPCFVCFNEKHDPILKHKRNLKCRAIYFHPQYLNVNMSFPMIRSNFYGDIAHAHDMFCFSPF